MSTVKSSEKWLIQSKLMKRLLIFGLIFVFIGLLSACGNGSLDSSGNAKGSNDSSSDAPKQDQEQNKDNVKQSGGIYFEEGVAEIDDVKIKITDTEVVDPDELADDHMNDIDGPVFAIWYDVTNKSDEPLSLGTPFTAVFDVVQDNDPDIVNELDSVGLAENDHYDKQMNDIKSGGTTDFSDVFDLDDEETPVTLIAHKGVTGREIGREKFEID